MKHEKTILRLIGIFFVILGISAYANSLDYGTPGQVFCFSYFSLMLTGIGMLFVSSAILLTQLNVIAIPYLIWDIDFFYVLITKKTLFGLTDYFFLQGPLLGKIITLQHLFTVPIILFDLYITKIRRKDLWKFSFAEMALIFIISKIFTLQEYNINCVYRNCMNFDLGPTWLYAFLWFAVVLIMVYLTNLLFIRLKFLNN